jgi:hypothetical protein
MERGYDFIWKAGEKPYLVPPSGRRMMLDVINNVPYLPVCSSTACAVASISQPEQTCFGSDSCYSIDDLSIDWGSDIDCSPAASDDEAGADNRAVRDLKAEAKSLRHLMTHLPKNPYCDSCQRAKMVNVHHKQGGGVDKFEATEFGEHITGDTLVLHGKVDRGINGESNGVVLFDIGTRWLDCIPVHSRNEDDTYAAMREFAGRNTYVDYFYCDGAPELIKAAKMLGWGYDTSTPGLHENNGLIEAKVKKVLNGGRVALENAGLPAKYWPYATRHFCFSCNIEVVNGDSVYNRRHKKGLFPGVELPFGC